MRRGVAKILLAVVSTLVVLFLADLLLRPLLRSRLYVRPTTMFMNRWTGNAKLLRYASNVDFTGTIHGDLAVMLGDSRFFEERAVRFVTDGHGFRNLPPAAERENPLIVLGDSYAAGSSGSQDAMVGSILEAEYGLTNYNLAVGGHGPWQELVTLKLEYPRLRGAKTVLWLLCSGNDLDDPVGADTTPTINGWWARTTLRTAIYFNRSPIRQMIVARQDGSRGFVHPFRFLGGRSILFFVPYATAGYRSREQVLGHPNFQRFLAVFEDMTTFCDSNALRLTVVLIPSKEEVYSWVPEDGDPWSTDASPSGFAQVLDGVCRSRNVEFLDLKRPFVEASRHLYEEEGKLLYWRDDTHWNDAGQRLAAQLMYERLFE